MERNKKPGEEVTLVVMRRDGVTVSKTITLKQDPTIQQVVSIETPTSAQASFRDAWVATRVK